MIGPMPRWVVPAAGVLLAVVGVVWVLQGTGTLGGSFMSGQPTWTVNGLIALGVGIAILAFSSRVRKR